MNSQPAKSGHIAKRRLYCFLLAAGLVPVMSGGAAERAPITLPKQRIEMAWDSDGGDSLRDALARSELRLVLSEGLHLRCEVESHRVFASSPELGLKVGLQYRFR